MKIKQTFLSIFLSIFLFHLCYIINAQSNLTMGIVKAVHDGDSYKIQTVKFDTTKIIKPNGDTIVAVTQTTAVEWFRLVHVDCPEVISNYITANQECGVEIGDSCRLLLKGKPVRIQRFGKDVYGRPLIRLYLVDGSDWNLELLKRGWAWYIPGPLDSATRETYKKIRDKARKNKRGLWVSVRPIAPSVWRQTHKRVR